MVGESEPLRAVTHNGEGVQWTTKPDTAAWLAGEGLRPLLRALVSAVVAGFVAFNVGSFLFPLAGPEGEQYPVVFGIVGAVVILIVELRRPLGWLLVGGTVYAATDRRLLKRERAVGTTLDSVPLSAVADTQCDADSGANDVETVTVLTDDGYEHIRFPYVAAPHEFATGVEDLAAKATSDDVWPEATHTGPETLGSDPAAGVRSRLDPEESVVWAVDSDATLRAVRWLPLMAVLSLPLLPVVAVLIAVGFLAGLPVVGVAAAALCILAVAAIPLGIELTGTKQYVATDRRLLVYTDRLRESVESVPVESIQDAEYDVGPVEQLLGTGHVTVDTDRESGELSLTVVDDPQAVAREITRLASDATAHRVGGD